MKVVDTDCKGMIIIQSRRGVYTALYDDELDEAIECLREVKKHRENGLPRVKVDSRR